MKPRSSELLGESEWSQRQRCDMDEARRVRSPRRPNQSSQYNELALSSRTLWRVVVCPRRESNPHLRFRKPPFYPLNYEDNDRERINGLHKNEQIVISDTRTRGRREF